MSYCLKTGGIIYDMNERCGYECDLHVEGNCIVAVVCGPDYTVTPDNKRITLIITENAEPLIRLPENRFGVIVVQQRFCLPSDYLMEHIRDWYPDKSFYFARKM